MQKHLIVIVVLFQLLLKLDAQTASNNELEKLRLKAEYSIGGGVICTSAGIVLTGLGIDNVAKGVWLGRYGMTMDWRPEGRILLSFGVPLFAGGVTLLAFGIHFRQVYLGKKRTINLSTGFLDDGNIGLEMRF
jgi:hypothetical protein